MSEGRRANVEGAVYLVLLSTVGWVDVFTRKELVEELVVNIWYGQEHKGLEIFAYGIMPSHLHLVVRREGGLLSERLRDFKSWTAKRRIQRIGELQQERRREWLLQHFLDSGAGSKQNKTYGFWKKDNHPVELFTPAVIDQKVKCIHMNPVVAGVGTEPEHYLLISAHPVGPERSCLSMALERAWCALATRERVRGEQGEAGGGGVNGGDHSIGAGLNKGIIIMVVALTSSCSWPCARRSWASGRSSPAPKAEHFRDVRAGVPTCRA